MNIEVVNYNGRKIKCEVKPDKKAIGLLLIPLIVGPIYMLIIGSYIWAGIIHIVALIGIALGGRTSFMDYKPIEEIKE